MIALRHISLPNSEIESLPAEKIRNTAERCLLIAAVLVVAVIMLWISVRAVASRFAAPAGAVCVKVRAGDSLWAYAEKYGNPNTYILKRVQRIAKMNGIDATHPLQPGQELIIPVERKTLTAQSPREIR